MSMSLGPPRDRRGHRRVWTAICAVALAAWALAGIARFGFEVRPGLRGRFFASLDWSGAAAQSAIQPDLNTAAIARGWRFTPPDVFSIRWSGYLYAAREAPYTFRLTSDDGSQLYVDGRIVVDNAGARGLATQTGNVVLAAGPHAIVVNYVNAAGPYAFDWAWSANGSPLGPVAGWLLSTKPRSFGSLLAARALAWLWLLLSLGVPVLLTVALLATGLWPAPAQEPAARAGRPGAQSKPSLARRRAMASLAFFAAAALAQTWPLARDPTHLSRNDNADTMLNEWAIAWVAHELPRAPLHLFDANMFYPERHTLAFSESLIVQGVLAAPLFALGASPVLAYNIVLLAGFALTGWAVSVMVAAWTDDWLAATAAGLMVAFNAHTLSRLPHIQAQHVEFLPLALLALDALLRRPRWRTAFWLAMCVVLQGLASVYLLVFTAIALAVAFVVRPEDWTGRRALDVLPKTAAAALMAGALLTPFLLPYRAVQHAGIARSLDEAGYFAATYRDYLTSTGRFHTWTAGGGSALFPGLVAIAFGVVALAAGVAFRDARARMCLAFGIVGAVLSLGPAVAPGYEFFFSTVPLLQGIRTSSRFGYLAIFGLAVVAAYGIAWLRKRLTRRASTRAAVGVAVVAAAFLDPLAAPVEYQPFDGVPAIYGEPASDPHAIVAELPLAPPEFQYRDASALLHSTAHWRPLVNGYSGFTPPGYVQRYLAAEHFPAESSVDALRSLGVNTLFVHTEHFDQSALAAMERNPALRRVGAEGMVTLYRLAPPGAGPGSSQ
jgi:hypothetical protein